MTFQTHAAGLAAALAISCLPGLLATAQAADCAVSGNAGRYGN